MSYADSWARALSTLPVLASLFPVVVALAAGWLPRLPGFALGAFVMTMIAIWLPRTWAMFWVLAAVNVLGATAYGISSYVSSNVWLAAAFIAFAGYWGGRVTKRFGALVALVLTAGATCGLNASAAPPAKAALMMGLGGLWSIICALGIPRPTPPAGTKDLVPPITPADYPLRCALSLSLSLVIGYLLWPAQLGSSAAAAAVVMRPEMGGTFRRTVKRVLAIMGAAMLSGLLLALHVPLFPVLVSLILMLCAARWLALDHAYSNPFIATTIILTLVGLAHGGQIGAAFFQRIAENMLGTTLALVCMAVPLSRRRAAVA